MSKLFFERKPVDLANFWIPVEQALPDDTEPILITLQTKEWKFPYVTIASYSQEQWLNKDDIPFKADEKILAWLPKPYPYQIPQKKKEKK